MKRILSMQDIVSYLAARGIRAERKSVYGDISCLQEFGMDIVLQKGPGGGYFLASRPFELAELKLLAGAVQASKFLSERKSVALIEKLSTLCSSYQAAQLERQAGRPVAMVATLPPSVPLLRPLPRCFRRRPHLPPPLFPSPAALLFPIITDISP